MALPLPPKAFQVKEDHNPYKCSVCLKGFRKAGLLADHMKHYHSTPQGSQGTRKRKKTLSTCE